MLVLLVLLVLLLRTLCYRSKILTHQFVTHSFNNAIWSKGFLLYMPFDSVMLVMQLNRLIFYSITSVIHTTLYILHCVSLKSANQKSKHIVVCIGCVFLQVHVQVQMFQCIFCCHFRSFNRSVW